MAKNKSSEVPHYEMLYIISNRYTEEESKKIAEKVKELIKKEGGEITYEEEWGKKKLAYPINHFNYGYYSLVEFDLEVDKLEKVNTTMRIMKEILRHAIIRKAKLTPEEIQKEKEKARAAIKKLREEKESKEEPKEEKVEEKKEEKKESKEKKKIDLKQLDEKLDKLLEVDDLL